jgi:hypothetical protein
LPFFTFGTYNQQDLVSAIYFDMDDGFGSPHSEISMDTYINKKFMIWKGNNFEGKFKDYFVEYQEFIAS